MPTYISKDEFRKKFSLRTRNVTLKSGETFQICALNMLQKRSIRQANMNLNLGLGKGEQTTTNLDIEGMIVDTIIAACKAPQFDELDRDWMLEQIDSVYVQELYNEIEGPVKLNNVTEEVLGNSKSS